MAQFETEEQQVEAIKQFWKDNGTSIILGAVIGFGSLIGWSQYSKYKDRQAEQASEQYSQALESIKAGEAESPEFVEKATTLIKDHSDSSYASLAALKLAQQYVSEKKFDKAAEQLQWLVDQGNSTFKATAQLRLARVLLEQDKFAEAYEVAKAVSGESRQAMSLLLQGEALLGQDKTQEAIDAFRQAKEAAGTSVTPLLAMRLAEFGIE